MGFMRNIRECRQRGASLTDYCLLVALIAVTAVVATHRLGSGVSSKFDQLGQAFYGHEVAAGENPLPNPGGPPPPSSTGP